MVELVVCICHVDGLLYFSFVVVLSLLPFSSWKLLGEGRMGTLDETL